MQAEATDKVGSAFLGYLTEGQAAHCTQVRAVTDADNTQ